MKHYFLLLFFIIVSFWGCKKNDNNPVSSNNQDLSYYPLKVGNLWTYTQSSDNSEQTLLCSSSSIIDGNTVYSFNGDDDYYFGYNGLFYKDGDLYRSYNNTNSFFLSKDPQVGDKYSSNFPDSAQIEILSLNESVTVPAGTFQCLKFSFYEPVNHSMKPWIYWMAKNVGVVKIEQQSTDGSYYNECKLKSYSLK